MRMLPGPGRAVLAVGLLCLFSPSTGAAAELQLPPFGGLDMSTCVGRAANPSANGLLIVRKRRDPSLYRVRENGSGLRRLTRPPRGYDDYAPAASPDGRRITFVRGYAADASNAPNRVFVLTLATGQLREIARSYAINTRPATWSPDGKLIAVSNHGEPGVELVHADGTRTSTLESGRWQMSNVSWSPNGRCLTGFAHPYPLDNGATYPQPPAWSVISATGGLPSQVLPRMSCPGEVCGPPITTPVGGPQWFPDGRSILTYVRVGKLRPSGDPVFLTGHVFSVRLSGAGPRILIRRASSPILSPDGRKMAAFDLRRQTGFIATSSGRRLNTLGDLQVEAWVPRPR